MNVHRSIHKGISAVLVFTGLFIAVSGLRAQVWVEDSLHNFIKAGVNKGDGRVVVLPLINGHRQHTSGILFQNPQLNFFDKSFFTCQINGTAYYTNNGVIPIPPPMPQPQNVKLLDDGVVSYIKSAYSQNNGTDTIRTIWFNKNGGDIIQDIWCIPFSKSGVVVYSWKFHNTTPGSIINVACQFLNDIQITDPSYPSSNSNDGPLMLTKYQYDGYWTEIAYNPYIPALPWFYIGFLYNLPNPPSLDPGLSAMGYLDYGAPLNLIKPNVYYNGDWFTLASWIWGISPTEQGLMNSHIAIGGDNAVLLPFAAQQIQSGQTVEIGRTAYGTGEYEECIGEMFSIIFYPHHLVWTKDKPKPPGSYFPDSVHIEKFLVSPPPNSAANTKVTLKVSKHLTLSSDSTCTNNLGQSVTKPSTGNGIFLLSGGVQYFDWWACPNPAYFCKGEVIDTLTFTATCSNCNPAFIDQNSPINIGESGISDCQLPIVIDCAETDINPPLHPDTVFGFCDSVIIHVHDNRKTDKGLASVTWTPTPKAQAGFTTDTNIVKVLGPFPPIKPCFFDTLDHVFYIWKKPGTIDTLAKGSYDFKFTDCIGNEADTTIGIPACIEINHPDTVPPVYTLIRKVGAYDSTRCDNGLGDNNRIDSFTVSDIHQYDTGIDTIETIDDSNMTLEFDPFTKCLPLAHFRVQVIDSMKNGAICIRTFDCAKPRKNGLPQGNYRDTCIYYCTLPDSIPPLVVITKDSLAAGIWHICVYDDRPWDRHIDEIFITGPGGVATNVHLMNIPADTLRANTSGKDSVCFDLLSSDTTKLSSFCIEATDLAGNRTKIPYCSNQGISRDTLCPNFTFTPPLSTNPTSVTVTVDDIHTVNGNPYVWDSGIDSIWFTGNHGMIVPQTIYAKGAKTVTGIIIKVRDTTVIDTVRQFCVTINAIDMDSNMCYATFCYPNSEDNHCPVTKLMFNPADSSIVGVVTDSAENDRGLFLVTTGAQGANDNLTPVKYSPNGAKVQPVMITRPNNMMSSVGSLTAQDVWGALSALPNQHLCGVNFAIWVQSFKMRDVNPNQNSNFTVPVNFFKNDSFAVIQKGITRIDMTLHIHGATVADLNSIRFDSLGILGTEVKKLGWDTTSKVSGANNEIITISLSMKPGGNLLDAPPLVNSASDSLVLLKFHANQSLSSRHVEIALDNIIFNKGVDSITTGICCGGINSMATMPAPYGFVDSATIVITGECAPRILTDSKKPTSVSLDPNIPNPFSSKTTFTYTVASEGPVILAVYDELGKEVMRLVDEVQKQGVYAVTFDGSKLSTGNYIVRLEAGGVVISRGIAVEK